MVKVGQIEFPDAPQRPNQGLSGEPPEPEVLEVDVRFLVDAETWRRLQGLVARRWLNGPSLEDLLEALGCAGT